MLSETQICSLVYRSSPQPKTWTARRVMHMTALGDAAESSSNAGSQRAAANAQKPFGGSRVSC
jgi:hypothetical protein